MLKLQRGCKDFRGWKSARVRLWTGGGVGGEVKVGRLVYGDDVGWQESVAGPDVGGLDSTLLDWMGGGGK